MILKWWFFRSSHEICTIGRTFAICFVFWRPGTAALAHCSTAWNWCKFDQTAVCGKIFRIKKKIHKFLGKWYFENLLKFFPGNRLELIDQWICENRKWCENSKNEQNQVTSSSKKIMSLFLPKWHRLEYLFFLSPCLLVPWNKKICCMQMPKLVVKQFEGLRMISFGPD